MQELQPPIYLSNIRIGEPVTTITDLLVSAVCFYAFLKLKQKSAQSNQYFRIYFLFLGLATLWGGLVTHAFMYYLSHPWKVPGWIMSIWAVSLLAMGVLDHNKKLIEKIYKPVVWLIVLELVLLMGMVVYTVDFKWAGVHSAFGMFMVVGSLSVYRYVKEKDNVSLFILRGVGVFLISGFVFYTKLSIHTWFNHVDLAHVLLAISAYLILQGALSIRAKQD